MRVYQSVTTANMTLALVVGVVSQDGNTSRGTLFSTFNVDTAWALKASAATRIQAQTAVSALVTQGGDRIVIEIGGHAAAPSTSGSYNIRQGNSAASDFALTTALTTDLNPWCEFSINFHNENLNNYQFVKAGDGMSVTEKIR